MGDPQQICKIKQFYENSFKCIENQIAAFYYQIFSPKRYYLYLMAYHQTSIYNCTI